MTTLLTSTWVDVCGLEAVIPGRGVAARVAGAQVAVFVLPNGEVHAIDNLDPFSGTNVMSRGIVGSKGDRVVVASPMYKQHFDLRSGECVEFPDVNVRTWPVRVVEGRLQVRS